ncbi:efflux transporter outer membrane subunit [Rhizobium sp.]
MRNLIILLAAGTMLTACSTDKFKPGPEIAVTEKYKNRTGRRGETINPETKWWANFGDSNLNALVEEALANNLQIESARENVRAAQLTARVAKSQYLPQIDAVASAEASGNRRKLPTPTYLRDKKGEIILNDEKKPIEIGSKNKWRTTDTSTATKGIQGAWVINPLAWKSTKESQAELVAANREALYAARLDIITAVVNAYVNAQGYGRQAEISKRALSVQNETSEITIAKVEAGSASTLDSTRAKANAALTSSDIPVLEQARTQSLNQIATLLGKTPAEMESVFSKYRALRVPRERFNEGIPADLLRNRPDIRQQERLLASAVASIGIAESELWPSLTLSGNVAVSRTVNASRAYNWSLGPTLNLPLFDRGALKANVDLSKSDARQQYLSYRQTVITAVREVEDAMVALRQEQQRYSRLATAVAELSRAEQLARELNNAGTTEFKDVLDAQTSLYNAQLQLADSQLQLNINYILLCQALGGGWGGENAEAFEVEVAKK